MMLKKCLLATSALVAAFAVAAPAYADGGQGSLADRVRKLEQELEKSKEYQQSTRTRLTTLEQNADAVQWSFDNGRPTIKSGDGRFQMSFRGRFHFDFANFQQNTPIINGAATDLSGGAVVRRAQFGVEGKVFSNFWYEMRFNFGGSSQENNGADINLMRIAYQGIDNFRINVGVIQPIFTHSDAVSSNEILFIERPQIINLLTGSFGGSDQRRAVEATFQKSDMFYAGDNVVLSGAFSGQRTGTSHTAAGAGFRDEGTYMLGRAAFRLWSDGKSNVQIGASGSRTLGVGGAAPQTISFSGTTGSGVDNSTTVTTGNMTYDSAYTYGAEAGANWKNLYISGEYYKLGVDRTGSGALLNRSDPEFSGWYVETSWILTGESKTYAAKATSNNVGVFGAPKVIKPFSPSSGSWGALELAARYQVLDLNYNDNLRLNQGGISGGEQTAIGAGLNWYLNNNVRIMLNYELVSIDKHTNPNAGAFVKQDNDINVISSRVQFAF